MRRFRKKAVTIDGVHYPKGAFLPWPTYRCSTRDFECRHLRAVAVQSSMDGDGAWGRVRLCVLHMPEHVQQEVDR